MATKFERLPRFAKNEKKQTNLTKFIASLEVSKKIDEKTKKERIVNFEEYFLFNSIYNSCSEIIRNENLLSDRNIKTRVHTIVTTSNLSDDLAFIANNIDGVTESLRNKVAEFGNANDFTALKEAATAWEKTSKEVATSVEKLRVIVETNLDKGYGSPRQLRAYESKKINAKKDEVKKLYFEEDKTTKEIAETYKVRHGLVQLLVDELIDEKLLQNIDSIREKLAEKSISRNDLAKEFKTSRKKLATFIEENELIEKHDAKVEPKKKKETTKKADNKK